MDFKYCRIFGYSVGDVGGAMNKDKIRKLEQDIQMNRKIMEKLNTKVKSLEFTNQKKSKELEQIKSKQRKSVL